MWRKDAPITTATPAYYAQQVMECVKAGARIVGGCCGTTPEHIRQIARLLGDADAAARARMGDEKADAAAGKRLSKPDSASA